MRSGFVSLIGRPNVGKSTLLNRYVGEKVAAVSPKPQTTRNRITGVRNGDGCQIVFIDTPGFHKPVSKMHRRMVSLARSALEGIDLILLMVDAAAEFGHGDRFVLRELKRTATPALLALNKIDLIAKGRLLPLIDLYRQEHDFRAVVPISALHGDGLEELEGELAAALPEADPVFSRDVLSDQPERSLAAEIIREKVFLFTSQEIPYCSAVLIDLLDERERGIDIAATILVERATQKGIVIGKGGRMLKKIGTAARTELAGILNTRVHLQLWVKVKDDWRDDDRVLREIGLG